MLSNFAFRVFALLFLHFTLVTGQRSWQCPKIPARIEPGRKCRKACRSDSDCTASKKNCYCDDYCGMSCFNKAAECDEPDQIPHGTVSRSHIRYKGTALYRCNNGYFRESGSYRRNCRSDKKWSGTLPVCRTGCSLPRNRNNAYPKTHGSGFSVGEVVEFSCMTGYWMQGSPNVKCQRDLTWSETQFSCNLQMCPRLNTIPHGVISYTNGLRFSTRAKVQCDTGYLPDIEENSFICFPGERTSRFGKWKGTLPECFIVKCIPPPVIDNGFIEDYGQEYEYGVQIHYECNTGYRVLGSSTGTCNENGTWGEYPFCEVDADCDFESFKSPICGYTDPSSKWVRTLAAGTWTGQIGYIAKSGENLARLISPVIPTTWTESEKICVLFHYKLPNSAKLEVISGTKLWGTHRRELENKWLDAAINFDMRPDLKFTFETVGGRVELDDVKVYKEQCTDHCSNERCLNGGYCVNRINGFTCFCAIGFQGATCQTDIKCSSPPSTIVNGYLVDNYVIPLPRRTVNYKCKDFKYKFARKNYEIRKFPITCYRNSWRSYWSTDPSTIRCEEVQCRNGDLQVQNSYIPEVFQKLIWYILDQTNILCRNGYEFHNGVTRLTTACQNTGKWDPVVPDCQKVKCPRLQIDNATTTGGSFFGDTSYISCNAGFELKGKSELRCQASKEWDREYPRCEKITCKKPVDIDNGVRMPKNKEILKYGDHYSYGCRSGYKLAGNRNRMCQADGSWSGQEPFCREILCPNPRTERSNLIVSPLPSTPRKWKYKSKVNFSCPDNYKLIGRAWTVCTVNSRWSKMIPYCRAKTCSRPQRPENGYFHSVPSTYSRGQTLKLYCNNGYETAGTATIVCSADGTWTNTARCQATCTSLPQLPTQAVWSGTPQAPYSIGGNIKFRCVEGYVLNGEGNFTCQSGGVWSNSNAACVAKNQPYCSKPEMHDRAYISDYRETYPSGSVLQFQCLDNFIVPADGNEIECMDNGRWSKKANCLTSACFLSSLSDSLFVENRTSTHFFINDPITVKCKEPRYAVVYNHWIVDSVATVCHGGNTWEPDISGLYCVIRCSRPEFKSGVRVLSDKNLFTMGSSVELSCDDHNLTAVDTNERVSVNFSKCSVGGYWSKNASLIECQALCSQPADPLNAILQSNTKDRYLFQERLKLVCNHNYTVVDSDTIVCGKNGSWSLSSGCKGSCENRCFIAGLPCGCDHLCETSEAGCCDDYEEFCGK